MTKEEIEDLSLVDCSLSEIELVNKAVNYIEQLEQQNKKQKEVIHKVSKKLNDMFANGDDDKLLDDLLELNKLLEIKKEK